LLLEDSQDIIACDFIHWPRHGRASSESSGSESSEISTSSSMPELVRP
jgi:hypothetical protein